MKPPIAFAVLVAATIAGSANLAASSASWSRPTEPVVGWSQRAAFALGGRLKADLRKQRKGVRGRVLTARHGYAYVSLNDADVQDGDILEAHYQERIYRERYGRPRCVGLRRAHAGTLLVVRADSRGALCKLVEGRIIAPRTLRVGHFRDMPTMNVEIRATEGSRRETAIARILVNPLKQRFRTLHSFSVADPDLRLPGSERPKVRLASYEPGEGDDESRSSSTGDAPQRSFVVCDVSEQGEITVFRLRLFDPEGYRVMAEAMLAVDPETLDILSPRTKNRKGQEQ